MFSSDKIFVAVLCGGDSTEREISIQSGDSIYKSLKRQKVSVEKIILNNHLVPDDVCKKFNKFFIAVHGRGGEDGRLQAFLSNKKKIYTGSGMKACALTMDKWKTKLILKENHIPTPKFKLVKNDNDLEIGLEEIDFPLVIKPLNEGSSFGVKKVISTEQLKNAIAETKKYGETYLIEKMIIGKELTSSIIGKKVLPLIEIKALDGLYDFKAKYISNETKFLCPPDLPEELQVEIKILCKQVFDLLGCSGWGRVDLMLDSNMRPWILEVNTVPGMTSHSLVPLAAKKYGWDFDKLVAEILDNCYVE